MHYIVGTSKQLLFLGHGILNEITTRLFIKVFDSRFNIVDLLLFLLLSVSKSGHFTSLRHIDKQRCFLSGDIHSLHSFTQGNQVFWPKMKIHAIAYKTLFLFIVHIRYNKLASIFISRYALHR